MCGIAGIVQWGEAPLEARDKVERMLLHLAHRGPDDIGIEVDKSVVLGHRRLSIIDLSAAGHQPMWSDDGRACIAYNGEAYNYLELKRDYLSGTSFRSQTDTEVLIYLYQRFGDTFVEKVEGMFALAIYDKAQNKLLLARDRFGEKPLYYYSDGEMFAFSSELRSLVLGGGIRAELNPQTLHQVLSFGHGFPPDTIFRGVRKLLPGQRLVVDLAKRTLNFDRFVAPSYEKRSVSEEEAFRGLEQRFEESVRVMTRADVPVGAFLSGGVDSSAVVATLSALGMTDVNTYSVGYRGGLRDETAFAEEVARRFHTRHHSIHLDESSFEVLPELVRLYGEPFKDSTAVPAFFLARRAAESVKVVLVGDGSDELLGYPRHLTPYLDQGIRVGKFRFGSFHEALAAQLGKETKTRLEYALLRTYLRHLRCATVDLDQELYSADFAEVQREDPEGRYWEEFSSDPQREYMDRFSRMEQESYFPEELLKKLDVVTMGASIEGRCPFLHTRFSSYANSLTERLRLRNGQPKYLLKALMRGRLPDSVIDRKKMGFSIPIESWFREGLRGYVSDILLSPGAINRGFFEPEKLRRIVVEHEQGLRNHRNLIWTLLTFEIWQQEFTPSTHGIRWN